MADRLVDTDVLVDHLRGAHELGAPYPAAYSVITRAELFAGDPTERETVQTLLAPMRELDVTRAIAERAGAIRRDTGVRLPDALIAATALAHGLTLLTRNPRDFDGIRGLRVSAPKRPRPRV